MSIFGFALLVSVFMPSLGRARPEARAISCRANLRSIAQSIRVYAGDHGGMYPDTLTALYSDYLPDPRYFLCPACTDTSASGATTRAVIADLTAGGHLSYVYAGAGLTDTTAGGSTVILFEGPGNHIDLKPAGINVVFGDGSAQWVTDFRPILDAYAAGVRPITYPPPPATAAATRAALTRTASGPSEE